MLPKPNVIDYDGRLRDCVLFDLDNTLAYHVERKWYEWDKILTDWCDPRYIRIVNIFQSAGIKVIFFIGRPYKEAYDLTKQWLTKYFGPMIDEHGLHWELFLADCDGIHGSEAKRVTYEQRILGKYNVICSFDDSQSCVDMWRSLGILTCQSNNGMK